MRPLASLLLLQAAVSLELRATFLIVWLVPTLCAAQDLTPRAYFPAPVSTNAVVVAYALSSGDILFDPALPITDATGKIHAPVFSYYHVFDFFGRSASITASFPFAVGDIRGNVSDQARVAHRAGPADAVVRLAVNLKGVPALSPAEFVKTERRSVLGASLTVFMPTGQYDHAQLINIGTNRWTFKPELGYMRRVGPLIVDAYVSARFFTTNDDFYASDPGAQGATRTQEPIGAMEFHVSYDWKPRLWISFDANYWRGGRTSVNGVESSATLQSNSRYGATGSVPLTRRQSLKFSYSDGMIVRVGGNFRTLSVGWQYGWLGVPFRGH